MKRFVLYIMPALLIFILLACEKNQVYINSADYEYVKYGTSFGECLGYCINVIEISDLLIDHNKSGWDREGKLPDVSKSETIDKDDWTRLVEQIDFNELLQLDPVIGCPDCADGGAEWIEIKYENISHRVIFEYQNEPEVLKGLVGYLRAYMDTF